MFCSTSFINYSYILTFKIKIHHCYALKINNDYSIQQNNTQIITLKPTQEYTY